MNLRANRELGSGKDDTDSEEALVIALKAGDECAAEKLVRSHASWMLATAKRITADQALAEDCVQEAFINIFNKIDGFEHRSSLKTWIHRIIVNQALMKRRAQRRNEEESIDALLPIFNENACRIEPPWEKLSTPEEILESEDRRALVLSKINDLPETFRLVLLLRDIENLSTRDVSESLDLSEANVKVRLHRARSALKASLEPLLRGELL